MNHPYFRKVVFLAAFIGASFQIQAQQAETPVAAGTAGDAQKKIGLLIDPRPLATLPDARAHAESWLKAAGLDHRPGKGRDLGSVYIIDLLDGPQSKKVSNQLLLRKQDGYAVLIYPASINRTAATSPGSAAAKEAMMGMAGMAGLAGMSGTKGVYGGNAGANVGNSFSSKDFLIKTRAEAQTAAKLWLFQNGLNSLKIGSISEQGGIFVGQVLNKDNGTVRNQFVIRRADGFIAMINPVKFPPPVKMEGMAGDSAGQAK